MKNLLCSFLLFGFFVSHPAFAQYQSLFGSQSTSWKFSGYHCFSDPDPISPLPNCIYQYFNDSVFVAGDSIIDSNIYKFLQSTIYSNDGSIFGSGIYYGFVREDSTLGKAWYKPYDNNFGSESLFYDLTLVVGDSFFLPTVNFNIYVDSVYYYDNRKHIQFDYYEYDDPRLYPQKFTFIEGIGTNSGFKHNYFVGSYILNGSVLLCSYKNQIQVFEHNYTQPGYNGCMYESISGLAEEKQAQILLAPNPASDKVQLNLEDNLLSADGQLQVLDILGRIVHNEQVPANQKELEINLADVNSGLYIVSLAQNGKAVWRQRLVVQK